MARPRKDLTPEQVTQVEKMAGHGLTLDQIADCLGIGERTLRQRFTDSEEVSAAYKRGRSVAINEVAQTVYQKAKAGEGAFPFFYLKTQAGWREVQRTEVSGPDGGPIETRVDGPTAADWLDAEVHRLVAREGTSRIPGTVPSPVRRNGSDGH